MWSTSHPIRRALLLSAVLCSALPAQATPESDGSSFHVLDAVGYVPSFAGGALVGGAVGLFTSVILCPIRDGYQTPNECPTVAVVAGSMTALVGALGSVYAYHTYTEPGGVVRATLGGAALGGLVAAGAYAYSRTRGDSGVRFAGEAMIFVGPVVGGVLGVVLGVDSDNPTSGAFLEHSDAGWRVVTPVLGISPGENGELSLAVSVLGGTW